MMIMLSGTALCKLSGDWIRRATPAEVKFCQERGKREMTRHQGETVWVIDDQELASLNYNCAWVAPERLRFTHPQLIVEILRWASIESRRFGKFESAQYLEAAADHISDHGTFDSNFFRGLAPHTLPA